MEDNIYIVTFTIKDEDTGIWNHINVKAFTDPKAACAFIIEKRDTYIDDERKKGASNFKLYGSYSGLHGCEYVDGESGHRMSAHYDLDFVPYNN